MHQIYPPPRYISGVNLMHFLRVHPQNTKCRIYTVLSLSLSLSHMVTQSIDSFLFESFINHMPCISNADLIVSRVGRFRSKYKFREVPITIYKRIIYKLCIYKIYNFQFTIQFTVLQYIYNFQNA